MGKGKMNEDNPSRISPALSRPPQTDRTGQKTNSTSGTRADQRSTSVRQTGQGGANTSNKKGK